jgi:hypothetical protein
MVPRHLSACLTLDLLLSRTLLTPNLVRSLLHGHSSSLQQSCNRAATKLAAGACCKDTARRSQAPPTMLFLAICICFLRTLHPESAARAQLVALRPNQQSFHRKFADTDASSSANPAPTSHATTLPVVSEELQHRQHPICFIFTQPNTKMRRSYIHTYV